ncbi:helix-turn-helix transcriptional regulator [uncultured Parolsenella sp.]|uniref:helix-turn-helix transcriptional regulator n=1 Tax=uncultured Parolsenella sp. TaxID=2083008 RepID=UPI0027DB3256|nr:helix-turn-helix transcriptional regulator [uncultured Parolsenella sp.]
MRRAPADITEFYATQFEQFGIELKDRGAVFTGEVASDQAHGWAWVVPLSPTCLVMEHFITPERDMRLLERTPEPYACVSEVSAPTLTCMPDAGITPAILMPPRGSWPSDAVCSFIQDNCGEELSPLSAGQLYHSRSVFFLPGFFEELEGRYPTEFAGLFEAFAEPWCDEAVSAIYHALRRVSEERARSAGGHVFMRGVVDTMVAELACSHAACGQALRAAGTRASAGLAGEAAAAVERALDAGQRVGIDELAASLYTSRSRLCAVFKAETGESLGNYMRRRRMERAQDLLADSSLPIAQIAELLGFPQQAAFAQAFKAVNGCSATVWRGRHR